MAQIQNLILFTGKAAQFNPGATVDSSQYALHTISVSGTGITTGATVKMMGIDPLGNASLLTTLTMTSASPIQNFSVQAAFPTVRVDISAYTDGTYAATYTGMSY